MTKSEPNEGRRGRVLCAVRAAADPIGVAELADELSVHPNTVRFHLDALERADEVERVGAEPVGRGRPRVRYRPLPGARRGERGYELLAGILASGLEGAPRGRVRAAEAGYAWGFAHAKGTGVRSRGAVGDLFSLLSEVGFAPRRADAETVELLNCPFRETVAEHGELVCAIHAGLMRGALAGWGARVKMTVLEPFAVPGACLAKLAEAEGA